MSCGLGIQACEGALRFFGSLKGICIRQFTGSFIVVDRLRQVQGSMYWTSEMSHLMLHQPLIKASLGAAYVSTTRLTSTPPLKQSGKFKEFLALASRKFRADPESTYIQVLWIIRP